DPPVSPLFGMAGNIARVIERGARIGTLRDAHEFENGQRNHARNPGRRTACGGLVEFSERNAATIMDVQGRQFAAFVKDAAGLRSGASRRRPPPRGAVNRQPTFTRPRARRRNLWQVAPPTKIAAAFLRRSWLSACRRFDGLLLAPDLVARKRAPTF